MLTMAGGRAVEIRACQDAHVRVTTRMAATKARMSIRADYPANAILLLSAGDNYTGLGLSNFR
jgi:hypothetical protein